MCLIPCSPVKELTAKKGMTVYKVLRQKTKYGKWIHSYVSPVYDFPYKDNTLYRLRKKLELGEGNLIHSGFHSYVSVRDAIGRPQVVCGRIYRVTIPKGAKYYLGINGDVVSTSIRIGNLTKSEVYL